jgi:hypothetical protein
MKISELIATLSDIQHQSGDVDVYVAAGMTEYLVTWAQFATLGPAEEIGVAGGQPDLPERVTLELTLP